MSERINAWLRDNSTFGRITRTAFQGVISVLIVNMDLLVGFLNIQPEVKPVLVAIIMAILSPIMSEMGKHEV